MRDIAKMSILVGVLFWLTGCGLIGFPQINAPKPPQTVYNYSQTFEKNPQVVQTAEGKSFVWEQQKQTVDVTYEKKEKPLSFWQRFCNWLGNLGFLGILGVIGFLIVSHTTPAAFFFFLYNKFKNAFKQTVKGIDNSGAVQPGSTLSNSLSSAQDTSTKSMVDEVKRQI